MVTFNSSTEGTFPYNCSHSGSQPHGEPYRLAYHLSTTLEIGIVRRPALQDFEDGPQLNDPAKRTGFISRLIPKTLVLMVGARD